MENKIQQFPNGSIRFNENESDYRSHEAIANSDISLIKQDPALVEWNRKISSSDDLVSPQIKEGKLFHFLFLQTNFYQVVKETTLFYHNNRIISPMVVYKEGFVNFLPGTIFTTLSELRAQLKADGYDVNTKTSQEDMLTLIKENNLHYYFLENERQDAERLGYYFLMPDEATKYFLMIESLIETGDFRKLFTSKWNAEVSCYLENTPYPFPLKCRIDMLAEYGGKTYIVDLKTISSIENVRKNIFNYEYYRQAAFYKALLMALYEDDREIEFLFAFVETTPKLGKYRTFIARVGEDTLQNGVNEIQAALSQYSAYLTRSHDTLYFVTI